MGGRPGTGRSSLPRSRAKVSTSGTFVDGFYQTMFQLPKEARPAEQRYRALACVARTLNSIAFNRGVSLSLWRAFKSSPLATARGKWG